jgi:hypothetical protein
MQPNVLLAWKMQPNADISWGQFSLDLEPFGASHG